MENKNILTLKYPASWWQAMWREALPSGNGCIGAAVYGGIYEETILLNHRDLWWKGQKPPLPDVSYKLKEVRKLLQEGEVDLAESILQEELEKKGYKPRVACPLPLGDLKIIMPQDNAFKNYTRSLNMETGEVTVKWTNADTIFSRRLFTSRADDMIVYEITKNGSLNINADIYLDLHDVENTKKHDGTTCDLPVGKQSISDGEYLFYSAKNDNGTEFGAVARIITDGKVTTNNDKTKIKNASNIVVLLKLFTNKNEWQKLKKELSKSDTDYPFLLNAHILLHKTLFCKITFDLGISTSTSNEQLLLDAYSGNAPTELIQKLWAYGRYLLISSTAEKGKPCALYGLWCGDYEAMWSFHMANENIQMINWQVLSGNMPQLLISLFDYYESMIDDFRINAKNLYGCRGIYIPAVTTPCSGLLPTISPHIIHWTGGAGWLAQHFFDYYSYTGDTDFLKNRALPFMREVALFYEDFFVIGEDGNYLSIPSNSPENTPGNYWDKNGMGCMRETTINATMDFAIAKEVLSNLIKGAKVTDMYQKDINKWQDMLSHIPPYQINDDGAVKEWMHPYFEDNYHHRHQSHIYPVFPGIEVTRENNPSLFEAFVTAVKKRLAIGIKEQTGWSFAHMANNYARMGEGDLALECIEILTRSCLINNFFTYHNDWRNMGIGVDLSWAPFQIDANMGITAAIQELLLFSADGIIKVLPALPTKWRKGEIKNLLARGNILVSMKWDLDCEYLTVTLNSSSAQSVTLLSPNTSQQTINLTPNNPSSIHMELS